MEMRQSNGMLEITKRGFNSPSHVIQRFDFFRRKSISVQIRNDTLIRILCDFKTNNTKIHIIVQIGMKIQKIKRRVLRQKMIFLGMCFNFVGLFSG